MLFNITYIITNALWCYILYLFIGVFFSERITNKFVHFLSYFTYYILSLFFYFCINIPLVFAIFNILAVFLITFNYKSRISRKILSAITIFAVGILTEVVVAMLFGYFKFNSLGDNTFSSIAGAISIRLALFVVVLLCRNFKSLKQGEKIPIYYWLAIFILPIFSLYVMFLLFNLNWVNNTTLAVACSAILGINFSVFYLHDAIIKTQSEKLQKDLLVEQNKSYEKQFELIEESVLNAEMIKHDFKHHLSVINGMLNTNQSTECSGYIQELLQAKSTYNSFINSGNIVIDSILNFKLKSIAKNNITVNSDITIPCDFQISSTDMTIILGNLLDNALEAVLKLETARNIDIILKETKGRFIIKIANTFNCKCIFKDGKIVSSKGQSGSHGLGLESVKYTLEKYNGELDIDIIGNIFSATVLFYL